MWLAIPLFPKYLHCHPGSSPANRTRSFSMSVHGTATQRLRGAGYKNGCVPSLPRPTSSLPNSPRYQLDLTHHFAASCKSPKAGTTASAVVFSSLPLSFRLRVLFTGQFSTTTAGTWKASTNKSLVSVNRLLVTVFGVLSVRLGSYWIYNLAQPRFPQRPIQLHDFCLMHFPSRPDSQPRSGFPAAS